MPPNVSYTESDQTPVRGFEAIKLGIDLRTGLDYELTSPHLSDWLKVIFLGDYEKFLNLLRGLSHDEVQRLVSKRESLFNVPAVIHVIMGAAHLYSEHPGLLETGTQLRRHLDVKDGHMKILIKLLILGVDVNVRDVGGRTPLHHCCLARGPNSVTLKMAERLIRAGADVNAKDRVGGTPILSCTANSTISHVRLLLVHGADPSIRANDGYNSYFVASPCIRDVFGEFDKKKATEERKMSRDAVGGSFRQCGVCGTGVGEKVMKRCSGKGLQFLVNMRRYVDLWILRSRIRLLLILSS